MMGMWKGGGKADGGGGEGHLEQESTGGVGEGITEDYDCPPQERK